MKQTDLIKVMGLTLMTLIVSACGGGGSNASPGSVVVEVPVESPGDGGDNGDNGGDGNDGGDGTVIAVDTVIPTELTGVITDSGATTSADFGSRAIFTIDVAALTGGAIDPTNLVLGNDVVFEISGGALRVSPPATSSSATASVLPNSRCILNLPAGAVIVGGSAEDFMVIEQGCAIVAEGTATAPVVFTARAEIDGNVEDGDRGLWGGLVINGRAPINDCPQGATAGTDACTKEGEANSGTFGGSDANDDSGSLRYVSVRYAGSNVDPENQLNGIAFQGVGDATTVEYVQVHNNLDDGIEFFGGTVNAKYVVLTGNADDSLDWTDGWQGNIQYLYIEQTDSGDNAIEADNREGNEGATPTSNPKIANMTVLGKSDENGLRLRRGTGLTLSNSFVDGSESCMRVDGTSRDILGAATDPTIIMRGVSFACAETHANDDDGAVENYLNGATNVSQNGDNVDAVMIADEFFENTDFVGAFGATDWSAGWTVSGSVSNTTQPDFGCPDGTTSTVETIDDKRVCQLSGAVTADLLLTSNNLYQLVGKVVIGGDNADSAVLTLQAGTTVYGASPESFLVISRGSQIVANGTRTAPIIFTAEDDLQGLADIDVDRGLWGGLVINGNAPINDCPEGATGGTQACVKEGEANSGTFGGAISDDSSGRLNYVVVKFAGSNVDPENQLNGIAFQAVGSGTDVNYVQVHNNLDDGIEFFGGTVNAKYVVLTGNADDSLDWTDGWQGSIQYLLINQAADAADNAIEADSREGNETALPRSLPRIANMSINGSASERAIRLRRGTGLELYNSIVQGNANCLRIQGDSLNQLGAGIAFGGVSFSCSDAVVEGDEIDLITAELAASENISLVGNLVGAVDLSVVLAADTFFDKTDFIGAVENDDNDWTTGWTVGMPDADFSYGCPVGTTEIAMIDGETMTCEISGVVNVDLALSRDNLYVLDGAVFIGGDNTSSAILSIQSGTTIIGDDPEDFLVISRGSQIIASGSANAPVIFTAADDINGEIANPSLTSGLWGGLVINGNAPINDCPQGASGGTQACVKEGEANSGTFGGADAADSSGKLNYVVVKYAGSNVDPENQLNGIAFQGVGSGTLVDYIQVYNNLDDGVEFFGGNVNASHVVLVGNADDSLDWTDGWQGVLQYVHIVQASDAGDNGIEADNREGDELATPRSSPMIANMSIVGNSDERGIRLRRGTGLNLYNSTVSGSASCLRVEGESLNQLNTGITFSGVSLGCTSVVDNDDGTVQTFLDGSINVSQDGSAVETVTLPGVFDTDGSAIGGSNVNAWSQGWTTGLQ